jgi:hypothetical protein
MNNPTRRSRNIGTSKQGHGQNNKMKIPSIDDKLRSFVERIDKYTIEKRTINKIEFTFIIEELRENCYYSCSINDIEFLIQHIDNQYFEDLKIIVFRQPKKKEQLLSSVWGRLIYYFDFPKISIADPAIIIEAVEYDKELKWDKSLKIEYQQELEILKEEGHEIVSNKRKHHIKTSPTSARNTQLFRTFFHELGHYNHYSEMVVKPETYKDEDADEWSKRSDIYFAIPSREKEEYANKFAMKLVKELTDKGIVPFEKK